jgi:tetratricopeptide (TPR) repeat protein
MPSRRGEKLKFPFRLIACVTAVAAPLAASAQPAPKYFAPKLLVRGTNEAALGGSGTVTVQVFVKKDGTRGASKVIKSSNPADNAAALEIAKSSTYKPALRGGKRVDAFYDFNLTFTGNTVAIGTGPLAAALATIRAGKYDQAKSDLGTYLQANPSDTQAYTLLGVADTFGGDPAGAAAAFDKAGTIPDEYKTLALQSYEKYATSALDAKQYPDAVAAAGHAIDLNPQSLQAYYVRGTAYAGQKNDTAAIADLQKARSIASASKADEKTATTLAFNLAVVQLDAGQFGEAATTAKDVARVDGVRSALLDKYAYASVSNAAVALANQGKIADSVSRLESGATAFPASAGALLSQAAYVLATDKKPDWEKVKAEAGKALAVDPNAGRANYVLGVAAANQNDPKGALDYMNKAKASPDYSSDASLANQIDGALKQLNVSDKPPM